MIVLLGPAKRLNWESCENVEYSHPVFLEKTKKLVKELKKMSARDLEKLMGINSKLAKLNFERYQEFKTPFKVDMAKQAAFAFDGDAYKGLDINSFKKRELNYAQKNLRILSGLYGLLSPLDLILPYRLEMGVNFSFQKQKNLYSYWQEDLTQEVNHIVEETKSQFVLNLASQEYMKAVNIEKVTVPVITPDFKKLEGGKLKGLGMKIKRARGLMSNYVLKNKIHNLKDLEKFNLEGLKYQKSEALTPLYCW